MTTRGHASLLLDVFCPRLRHLRYSVVGDDTSILRGLAKLSQLRSLELRPTWMAWRDCEVEDLLCMDGLYSLEVRTLTCLQYFQTEGEVWAVSGGGGRKIRHIHRI